MVKKNKLWINKILVERPGPVQRFSAVVFSIINFSDILYLVNFQLKWMDCVWWEREGTFIWEKKFKLNFWSKKKHNSIIWTNKVLLSFYNLCLDAFTSSPKYCWILSNVIISLYFCTTSNIRFSRFIRFLCFFFWTIHVFGNSEISFRKLFLHLLVVLNNKIYVLKHWEPYENPVFACIQNSI